jgi:predicted NBD/HSP70 family sugar kinase
MVPEGSAARPQHIRVMNEQLVLGHIRAAGELSRADLARTSGLAKNTVSQALANLERSGLVRTSGVRTGLPGPQAVLYQVDPRAGYVLGLDVGSHYLRGAVTDLSGVVRARTSRRVKTRSGSGRVAELAGLGELLCAEAGIGPGDISQTVLGSPGIYDPARDALELTGSLPGWDQPGVLRGLRTAFGDTMMLENDVDAAALAEQAHGHGRDVDNFAFVSVGTGIGMGLVIGGRLHRGAHGAAGEIGYLPIPAEIDADAGVSRRQGRLEIAASASGVVRAARQAGIQGPVSARSVFAAAGRGDDRATRVVAAEALLVANAICAVVAVADPDLIVLGGGIGRAEKFLDEVAGHVRGLAPVVPEMRVSALGDDAVVDGCLAAGSNRLWERLAGGLAPTP